MMLVVTAELYCVHSRMLYMSFSMKPMVQQEHRFLSMHIIEGGLDVADKPRAKQCRYEHE